MKIWRSKFGTVLAGAYLVLVVLAEVWANISAQTNPAESGETALLAFNLTLPWSLILALALETVKTGLLASYLGLLVVLVLAAAMNAVILYFLGAVLGRAFSGRRGS